jgi:hypothetical protein
MIKFPLFFLFSLFSFLFVDSSFASGLVDSGALTPAGFAAADSGQIIPANELSVDAYLSSLTFVHDPPAAGLGINIDSGIQILGRSDAGLECILQIGIRSRDASEAEAARGTPNAQSGIVSTNLRFDARFVPGIIPGNTWGYDHTRTENSYTWRLPILRLNENRTILARFTVPFALIDAGTAGNPLMIAAFSMRQNDGEPLSDDIMLSRERFASAAPSPFAAYLDTMIQSAYAFAEIGTLYYNAAVPPLDRLNGVLKQSTQLMNKIRAVQTALSMRNVLQSEYNLLAAYTDTATQAIAAASPPVPAAAVTAAVPPGAPPPAALAVASPSAEIVLRIVTDQGVSVSQSGNTVQLQLPAPAQNNAAQRAPQQAPLQESVFRSDPSVESVPPSLTIRKAVERVTVKPAMPRQPTGGTFVVQVAANEDIAETQRDIGYLMRVGLLPSVELYRDRERNRDLRRIVIRDVRFEELPEVIRLIGSAGYTEVWLRNTQSNSQ